jgi:hypothetical protein
MVDKEINKELEEEKECAFFVLVGLTILYILFSPIGFHKIAHVTLKWMFGYADGFLAIPFAFGIGTTYAFILLFYTMERVNSGKNIWGVRLRWLQYVFLMCLPVGLADYFVPRGATNFF